MVHMIILMYKIHIFAYINIEIKTHSIPAAFQKKFMDFAGFYDYQTDYIKNQVAESLKSHFHFYQVVSFANNPRNYLENEEEFGAKTCKFIDPES